MQIVNCRVYRKRLRAPVIAALAISMLSLGPHACLAWNDAGHRLVALIAYSQLSPETRAKVVELIKKHERYQEDFADRMPENIQQASEAQQHRWIFAQAATWPDIARGFQGRDRDRFHAPTWHYINEPLFLSEDDRDFIGDNIPVNLDKEWSEGTPADRMNVVQALHKSQIRLSDRLTSPRRKAVYMCWLFHLVGDVHQPLHASALFSRKRFPGGDRGGNSIPIRTRRGNRSLHSIWDGMLGRDSALNAVSKKANSIVSNEELKLAGEAAAGSLDPEDWVDESYEAAWEFVYDEPILNEVAELEFNLEANLRPISLSRNYYQAAGGAARRRAAEAGFRLAALVEQLVNDD